MMVRCMAADARATRSGFAKKRFNIKFKKVQSGKIQSRSWNKEMPAAYGRAEWVPYGGRKPVPAMSNGFEETEWRGMTSCFAWNCKTIQHLFEEQEPQDNLKEVTVITVTKKAQAKSSRIKIRNKEKCNRHQLVTNPVWNAKRSHEKKWKLHHIIWTVGKQKLAMEELVSNEDM